MKNRIPALFLVCVALAATATAAGNQVDFILNPFSSNGPFGGIIPLVAALIRRIIAWGIVVRFFVWVLQRLSEMAAAPFATAPFGDSIVTSVNSIKVLGNGGGIGYAAKLVVYGLIAVVLLTMPLTVMAAVTTGLPWSSLVQTYSAGPGAVGGSGMLSQALWMANQVVPWWMLMASPVWYFFVQSVLFPSQLFWSMFIKLLPT